MEMELYIIYSIAHLLLICNYVIASKHCPALSQSFDDFGIDFCEPSSLITTQDDIYEFLKGAKCQGYVSWDIAPTLGCKSPTLTEGVKIEYPCGCDFGAKCTVKCEHDYELEGSETIVCQDSGSYSKLPTCVKPKCRPPRLSPNLILDSRCKLEEGESCSVACSSAFRLKGPDSIKCDHGHWTQIPTCQRFCPMSDIPSTLEPSPSCDGDEKEICAVSCRNKKLTLIGLQVIECSNGKWNTFPTCACNSHSIPHSIKLKKDCVIATNKYCNAECGSHYYQKGNRNRIFCDGDGEWNLGKPNTIQCWKACHSVHLPHGVKFKKPCPRAQYGEVCEIACEERTMKLSGADTFHCLESGKYSTISGCSPDKQCSRSLISSKVKFIGECLNIVGDTCSVGCIDSKAVREGPSEIRCLESGAWSSSVECVIYCPPFPSVAYFQPTDCERVRENAKCDVTCKRGYVPMHTRHVKCLKDGVWPAELPKCDVTCGFPPLGRHTVLRQKCTYNENDICIPSCDSSRYALRPRNAMEIKCLSTGKWSAKPNCNLICSVHSLAHHLKLADSCRLPISLHEVCVVTCKDPNSLLTGSDKVICTETGIQNYGRKQQICVPVCYSPPTDIRPGVTLLEECRNLTEEGLCKVRCKDGKIDSFLCVSEGQWVEPFCYHSCSEPALEMGTKIEGFCRYSFGVKCKVVCTNATHTFQDGKAESYITCKEDSTWTQMPACYYFCPLTNLPYGLQIRGHCVPLAGVFCNVVCSEHKYMSGVPTMRCTPGGWTNVPKCLDVCEPIHLHDSVMFVSTCSRLLGDTCLLKCTRPATRFEGPDRIQCQRNAHGHLAFTAPGFCTTQCPAPVLHVGTVLDGVCVVTDHALCKVVCENPLQRFQEDRGTEAYIDCENAVWSSEIPLCVW